MSTPSLGPEKLRALATLANGIIPADESDAGAAAVDAGPRLAGRIEQGVNARVYVAGLELAETVARERFGGPVDTLSPVQVHELLAALREQSPGFFKQLRMDVSALYLSDPGVWRRIGFPGPSTRSGGYPDFDKPQIEKADFLKEAPP
jgi:Gluconate 2-dehydrogenase subunit 3